MVRIGETAIDTCAMFVAEPFESGYWDNVANSIDRVLSGSIEGIVISSIKIAGVAHEFQSMPRIVKDFADIALNLKKSFIKISFARYD
jgi:DNA-directed RNA polymerase subunit alpha